MAILGVLGVSLAVVGTALGRAVDGSGRAAAAVVAGLVLGVLRHGLIVVGFSDAGRCCEGNCEFGEH